MGGSGEPRHVQACFRDDGPRQVGVMPGISASRATAGSTAASGPVPVSGPIVPPASTPQAAGIAAALGARAAAQDRQPFFTTTIQWHAVMI